MTARHRPAFKLAVLAAVLLMTLVVPVVDARMPRATRYHVGGPITLDTNLRSRSGVAAWAIDAYLAATTSLPPLGGAFIDAEKKYGVNARFLLAAALHESAWGTGYISRAKHNLFGYNAYDRDPVRYANAYATYAANINATARFIRDAYLTPGGRWWGGRPTLRSMQQFWSSSHRWGEGVSRIATSIRLPSIARRSIRFAAPVASGPLHAGSRAQVRLTWRGGTLPDAIGFVARWVPVELDSDAVAATISSPLTGAPGGVYADVAAPPTSFSNPSPATHARQAVNRSGSTGVAARRVRTGARAVTLAVTAPREPGSYLLEVELRDAGGRLLPRAERLDIPDSEFRVWGARAVSYDLAASDDGTGAVVRITNTGRTPIPSVRYEVSPDPRDPEADGVRSVVTVTASSGDPANPQPVLVLASPLAGDLQPGASATFNVTGSPRPPGRAMNWLSVNLSVLGDTSWLGASSTAGTWFSDATFITLVPVVPTPTPTPAPTPAPTPSANPGSDQHAGASPHALARAVQGPRASHDAVPRAQRRDPLPRRMGRRAVRRLRRRERRLVDDARLDRDAHLHGLLRDLAGSEGTDPRHGAGAARRARGRASRPVAPILRRSVGALHALLPRHRPAHTDDQGAPDAEPPVRRDRRARRQVLTSGSAEPSRARRSPHEVGRPASR